MSEVEYYKLMAPVELLSCPFCGSEALVIKYDGKFAVVCSGCVTQTEFKMSAAEAIAAWNRRHPMVEEGDVSDLPEELRPGRRVI